jgi:hypothetical protein
MSTRHRTFLLPTVLARPVAKEEEPMSHPYDAKPEPETRYTDILMTPEFGEEDALPRAPFYHLSLPSDALGENPVLRRSSRTNTRRKRATRKSSRLNFGEPPMAPLRVMHRPLLSAAAPFEPPVHRWMAYIRLSVPPLLDLILATCSQIIGLIFMKSVDMCTATREPGSPYRGFDP